MWTGLSARSRRFIPTCVGNMKKSLRVFIIYPVHPHVCGKHTIGSMALSKPYGSSPRVWGTFVSQTLARNAASVHPHVCGEHAYRQRLLRMIVRFIPTCVGNMKNVGSLSAPLIGSSPRVWGTCLLFGDRHGLGRFIPTCVGNMHAFHVSARVVAGSSPRVWGTCLAVHDIAVVVRFIPPCVGNIHLKAFCKAPSSVHPHVCGEHPCPEAWQDNRAGSSPRVWGTCSGFA